MKFKITLLLIVIIEISCYDREDMELGFENEQPKTSCFDEFEPQIMCDSVYLGTLFLAESSKFRFPYKEINKTYTYSNVDNEKLVFESYNIINTFYNRNSQHNSCDENDKYRLLCSTLEETDVKLINDSLELDILISLKVSPNYSSEQTLTLYDAIDISTYSTNDRIPHVNFSFVFDRRDLPDNAYIANIVEYYDNINLANKTFKDVYTSIPFFQSNDPELTRFYFNEELGIVGIEYPNGEIFALE